MDGLEKTSISRWNDLGYQMGGCDPIITAANRLNENQEIDPNRLDIFKGMASAALENEDPLCIDFFIATGAPMRHLGETGGEIGEARRVKGIIEKLEKQVKDNPDDTLAKQKLETWQTRFKNWEAQVEYKPEKR